MDLSVEANALGRYTIFPGTNRPRCPRTSSVPRRPRTARRHQYHLRQPAAGFVETVRMMRVSLSPAPSWAPASWGPFTLAGAHDGRRRRGHRHDVDPPGLHRLLHFTTERIQEYLQLLLAAGADVICILEPTAVMLSPPQFAEFSAVYIRHITQSFKYSRASFVYHTCGNTMHLVETMGKAGVHGVSLDSPETGVDLREAAKHVPEDVVVIGNIRPGCHHALRHCRGRAPRDERAAGVHARGAQLRPQHGLRSSSRYATGEHPRLHGRRPRLAGVGEPVTFVTTRRPRGGLPFSP